MPTSSSTNKPAGYDVFNGDADGLCALHQLRLAEPVEEAVLVTGIKRDIALLKNIEDVRDSIITVLDISLDVNREPLTRLLAAGNRITYVDHHFAGDIPTSTAFDYRIDPSPDTCTSLLVNELLGGRHVGWALCGAFGDNLHPRAHALAADTGFTSSQLEKLKEIGELLNYNGYGGSLADLYFHPRDLYESLHKYSSPFDYYEQSTALRTLRLGYRNDMAMALAQPLFSKQGTNRVFRFPDNAWARRISGVFTNLKARENPTGAHALITENEDDTLRISVRAPLTHRQGADLLCRAFPTGGGRAAAAGINNLPADRLDAFLHAFTNAFK
jgi:hypothetical protein